MDFLQMFNERWWKPSGIEVFLIIVIVFVVPFAIAFSVMLYRRLMSKRIHDNQLFLFRLKRLGMSNFQIKIINNLIGILRFSNPNLLLEKSDFFETAVGQFLSHADARAESVDSQAQMCRDITIIYDKLYYRKQFKKPLGGVQDIDEFQLLYFAAGAERVYLGKIVSRDGKHLYLKIFATPVEIREIAVGSNILINMFRVGDADYRFAARIAGQDGNTISISLPGSLERGEESRHPYIDVIIQASLTLSDSVEGIEDEHINCTIYKINEYEAVLRTNQKLDFKKDYMLEFVENEFNFKILTKILTGKTIEEGASLYYTMKFGEMTEISSRVLKKYLREHL